MERLRQSDLQSLLGFVRECYAVPEYATFDAFVARLLTALSRLIPAAHITYNEMHPGKSESRNCVNTAELATPLAARLWENHMNEHPALLHVLQTADRRAMRISDFWSELELRDSGLHSDFYKRFDIGDALCITVPCPLPRVIGVGWHDRRRFSDRERLIADLARPHISQAWQNARLLGRMNNQMQMLQAGFESLGNGVIVCGFRGRVEFINACARRLLTEYFAITRQTDHRLPSDLLLWMRQQNSRLNENDDAPPVRSPLILEKKGKRLAIRLLTRDDASVILMEEEQTVTGNRVAESLGLTAREAEVLTWIARGKSNGEIATILGVHTGTVKKHVEHIFEKLGVETRTAAAAVTLGIGPSS